MRRAEPDAGAPTVERVVRGRDHRGMRGEPEVVVRRERHDRRAVGRDRRPPDPAASRSRGARHRPASRIPRASPLGPRVPGHRRRSVTTSRVSQTSSIESESAFDDPVDLRRGDRERRHQHDGVADRPEQHAPLAPRRPTRCRPQRRPSAGGASSTPPIRPSRRTSRTAGFDATRSCEQVAQLVGPFAHVGEHAPRFDELEVRGARPRPRARSRRRSARGRACARRGRRRGTSGTRGSRRDGRRHRQVARGHRLAEAQQVGPQPGLLRREQRAGAAEAGRDLVADQQHVVLGARGAEAREPVAIGELHAGRALHERLDDHGRELGRVLGDERDAVSKQSGSPNAGARSTGKRSGSKMSAPKPSSPTESAPIVSPWYAPPNARKVRARRAEVRPVLERDLQRLLDRRRAVGRVEEVRLVDGHDAGERLGELDHRAVAVAEHRRVRAERRAARGSRRRARGCSGRAC